MLRDSFLAFDDDVVNDDQRVTSRPSVQRRLGAYDQLGFHCRILNVTVGEVGTFNVTLSCETSGDGENWVILATSSQVYSPQGPYPGFFLSVDGGETPFMHLVRLRLFGTGNMSRARVRVFASLRDTGGGEPSAGPGKGSR